MKITTDHTKEVWASGDFVGDDRRPTARVTIQQMNARNIQYRIDDERSHQWAHSGAFSSILFGQEARKPRELHNVLSVKWSRGVDIDVGTCTIVLGNIEARTQADPSSDEMDRPGFYTPNRGTEDYFDRWGYIANGWKNWLVPDRLIRTFEGYGVDLSVAPEHDDHLYPSGTWLIDDVNIDHAGTITLECRDLARVLMDKVTFPPAVPWNAYPLWWDAFKDRGKPQKAVAGSWVNPTYVKDSNLPYIGSGRTDTNGKLVVESDGTVYGHHGRDAFDGATSATAWLSSGKGSRTQSDAYEFIEGSIPTGDVQGIRVDAHHGPYVLYVSLQNSDGTWLGNKRIPYRAINVDVNANIRYVGSYPVQKGEIVTIKFPKPYKNIQRIRYTFGHLAWSGIGAKLIFRAFIDSVYYSRDVHMETVGGTWKYGNYGDYSTIVKWFCAWGGFFWPSSASGYDVMRYSDGSTENVAPATNDPAMIDGRVWGDFELTGTKGIAKFDVDVWDKKPFMDCIGVVRDIIGFDFWVDETGGVIWRLPNIWTKGCYIMPTRGGPRVDRTSSLVKIDERFHLMSMTTKLSSRSIRERIYVGNTTGHVGAVVRGFRPDQTSLKRYAGWTDQHFTTNEECELMADLIALKQMFLYRQNSFVITANPALQPDDQIVIYERMTGEGYIHRITNISSDYDADTGRWAYTLSTNWLGTEAFTKLAWDPEKMTNTTKVFLHYMGKI